MDEMWGLMGASSVGRYPFPFQIDHSELSLEELYITHKQTANMVFVYLTTVGDVHCISASGRTRFLDRSQVDAIVEEIADMFSTFAGLPPDAAGPTLEEFLDLNS
jgi:hypothetical protein